MPLIIIQAGRIRMCFSRPSAFILALLTASLIGTASSYMTPGVSAELPMVNGPVTRLDRVADVAAFRCDSLSAKDCFEMFHRRTADLATTVPFMPLFDLSALTPAS